MMTQDNYITNYHFKVASFYETLEQKHVHTESSDEIMDEVLKKKDELAESLVILDSEIKTGQIKVDVNLFKQYDNEFHELEKQIHKDSKRLDKGKKKSKKAGGILPDFLKRGTKMEEAQHKMMNKLNALDQKIKNVRFRNNIYTDAEKQQIIQQNIAAQSGSFVVGDNGRVYELGNLPAGMKGRGVSLNNKQLLAEVKRDPMTAITKHGVGNTAATFLDQNTFMNRGQADFVVLAITAWLTWKTIKATYDSPIGGQSRLRTGFIAAVVAMGAGPALKARFSGGADKLNKPWGELSLDDFMNGFSSAGADAMTKYSEGSSLTNGFLYGMKDTALLKEYYDTSTGTIKINELDTALDADEKDGAKKFAPNPKDLACDVANTPYYAFNGVIGGLAANPQDAIAQNQNFKEYNDKLKQFGLFDLGTEITNNTPISQIRSKYETAKSQLETKLTEEAKKEQEAKVATIKSGLPAGYQIIPGKEAAAIAVYEANKALLTSSTSAVSDERKKVLFIDLIEPIPAGATEVSGKLGELSSAFGPNRNEKQKGEFIRQFYEMKKQIDYEYPSANVNLTAKDGAIYLHSFMSSMKIDTSNPNSMFIDSPDINGIESPDTRPTNSIHKVLHLANATNGLINFFATNNYSLKTQNPFTVGGFRSAIQIEDNSGGSRSAVKEFLGMSSRQKLVEYADLDNTEQKPYADFLNGLKTGATKVVKHKEKKEVIKKETNGKMDANGELIYTERKVIEEVDVPEKVFVSIRDGMAVVPQEYLRFDNISSYGSRPDPIKQTKENTQTTGDWIIEGVSGAFDGTGKLIENSVIKLVNSTGRVADVVLENTGNILVKATEEGGRTLTTVFDKALVPTMERMMALLENPKITGPIKNTISSIISFGGEKLKSIITIIDESIEKVDQDILNGLFTDALNSGKDVFGAIGGVTQAIRDNAGSLSEKVVSVVDSLAGIIEDMGQSIEKNGMGFKEIAVLLLFGSVFKK